MDRKEKVVMLTKILNQLESVSINYLFKSGKFPYSKLVKMEEMFERAREVAKELKE